ncbi:MAG: response regulator [Deltaproteobacteria bacterium]|nr:response regulator [Deltaproteobacteria bacterium]
MSAEGFFGPSESNLVDLIQMWGLAKTSGILTVKSGKEDGEMHFEEGRVVWANAGPYLSGEDAIYHLLALEEGRFRFVNSRELKHNGELNCSYSEIIMEGMRRLDHLKLEMQGVDEKLGFIPFIKGVPGSTNGGSAEVSDEEKVFMALVDGKRNLEKVFDNCGLGAHKSFKVFKALCDKELVELRKVRVLVVDDQSMWRNVISNMLLKEPCFEVIATAEDGVDALQKISELKPDVITLDLEMPRLDGIKTLYWMMSGGYDILLKSQHNVEIKDTFRCPVVVISAVATKMAPETLEALMGGATGYITKPSQFVSESLEQQQKTIAKTVLMASQVDLQKSRRIKALDIDSKDIENLKPARKLVCVGASMVGGLTSLMQLIPQFPENLDGSVFVVVDDLYSIEHTKSFAEFLDRHSKIKVEAADKNNILKSGTVYISSADNAVEFGQANVDGLVQAAYRITSKRQGEELDKNFKPLDTMLESAIKCKGFDKRIGVVLAGDGTDGKIGFLEMVKVDDKVFAQDSYSSLNPIKPENVANTGVARVIPLAAMVKSIIMEVGRSV